MCGMQMYECRCVECGCGCGVCAHGVCECVRSVGDACEGNSNLKVSSLQLVVYIIIKYHF